MNAMKNRLYHYYFFVIRLKTKFLLSHLLIALLPAIVLASFSYNRFAGIITSNTISSLEAISQQTASSIEAIINQAKAADSAIAGNDFFSSFIRHSDPNALLQTEGFSQELLNFLESIEYNIDGKAITSIHLYLDSSHFSTAVNVTENTILRPLNRAYGSYWYGILKNSDSNLLVCPSMYLSPTEVKEDGELAIIRKYILADGSQAFSAIYFSQNSINNILLQDIPFTDSVFYVVNQRDSIVTTTNPTLSGTYYLNYQSIPESISNTGKFSRLNFVDEMVYVGYKVISGTDWYMVSAIPSSNIVSQGNSLLIEFIAMYLVFLVLCIFASILISNSIITRLSNVIHQMKNVRNGPPCKLHTTSGRDEIADLVETYNYMSDEINHLLIAQQKSSEELRLAEFHALQSQINPHFLYNTLDMINWQAKSGNIEEVSAAVQLLSRFYKLTLNKGKNVVSIREELEHVSLYVKLQNMRFNGSIGFFIDVPEEMLSYQIPKLIFQPLVENSLLHGIFEKVNKQGQIVIMGWMEETQLVFVISDDGIGITKEKITSILSGSGNSQTGSNIGVYNTHRRLQLYYNVNSGLSYRSILGQETEVEIRIPKERA